MRRFADRLNLWAREAECAAAEAVNASALRGAELARGFAPVDSGELRSGIAVQSGGGTAASVVSAAAHAAMVEYGTSRMAAQSYMLSMAEAMRGEFAQSVRSAVQEVFG